MPIYKYNQTGKIFFVLKNEIEKTKKEPYVGDDLVQELKEEISLKVSDASHAWGDEFPISKNYSESPIGGGSGPISSIQNGQANIIDSFASEEIKSSFRSTSNSGQLSGFQIKKGKYNPSGNAQSMTEVINDIDLNSEKSKISTAVNTLLSENGTYSPANPIIPTDGTFNENNIILGSINYTNNGEHGPRKFPTLVEENKSYDKLSIQDMKQMGLNILLAGSGESDSVLVSLSKNTVAGPDVANLISSATELGSKINFGKLKAGKVLETIKPGYKEKNDGFYDNSYSVMSFGAPNNPLKPFHGTGSPVSIAKTFTLISLLSFMLKKIALTYGMTGRTQGDHMANGSSRDKQKLFGNSLANGGSDFIQQALDPFELPQLTNDFFLSLDAGFKQFFSIGDNTISTLTGAENISSIKNFGYYSIFIRKLNAATQDLIVGGFGNLLNGVNNQNPTVVRTETSAEMLMEGLKSNFAIKFIKFLALIGDKALIANELQQQSPVPGLEGHISAFDGIPEKISNADNSINPGILIVKHRLDEKNGSQTIGTSTIKSMFLLPQSVTEADKALNRNKEPMKAAVKELSKDNKVFTNDYINGRIPKEEVKKMEDYLERDYMPFYFHDLRTNEIISFHAFLDSATDSIQAEYNETEGYGRVGVIPIYKNTKRSINFSFKVLAVNDGDHDQMWYKLNRLAACLYPQYSEGRLLEYQGNKFIQPFSQVFAASPLIRLRLGDLWKSNYSKLAVARLFGLSGQIQGREETFKLATTRQISARQPTTNIREQQQRRNNEISNLNRPLQPGDRVQIRPTSNKNRWPIVIPQDAARTEARSLGQQIGQYRIVPGAFLYIPAGFVEGEIVEYHPSTRGTGNNYLVRITNPRAGGSGQQSGFRTISGNRRGASPTSLFRASGDDPTGDIVCVNPDRLTRILPEAEPEITDSTVATEAINNSIDDFFKCDGENPNPIMKAFCTTEGKGLACVIKSMNFENIMEAPWVTDKFDGRAPSLVTVNMEITPIYDVSPGLDYKGAMTAPIWAAGQIVTNMMGNEYSSEQGHKNFIESRVVYNFPSIRGPRT